MAKFRGSNVLITGASSGIGLALAHEFARLGANLLLVARRRDRLEALQRTLSDGKRKVVIAVADVSRDGEIERAVGEGVSALGSLDVVVANAGFGVVGNVEDLTLEDYRRQLETNFYGVLRTVYATLPHLKRSRGRLGIVGSVNGFLSLPGNSPYAVSKYALRALCDSLGPELSRYGVAVTHIAPGFVESEIRQVDNQGMFHRDGKDRVPRFLQMPAPVAARKIAHALYRRRTERILTGHGWFAVLMARHFPRTLRFLVRFSGITARPEPRSRPA